MQRRVLVILAPKVCIQTKYGPPPVQVLRDRLTRRCQPSCLLFGLARCGRPRTDEGTDGEKMERGGVGVHAAESDAGAWRSVYFDRALGRRLQTTARQSLDMSKVVGKRMAPNTFSLHQSGGSSIHSEERHIQIR